MVAGWFISADIIFVLDLSESIEKDDFEEMKQFQLGFVEEMIIGEDHNQVGTIIFKHNASTVFHLNEHTNKEDLLQAINETDHNELGLTNIQDALCLLNTSFDEERGGRSAERPVFRIAILMTDGMSNQHHSPCNWRSSGEAAREVHKSLSPLELCVIGVGDKINQTELEDIASPGCYAHIDSFDYLSYIQGRLLDQMSHRGKSCMLYLLYTCMHVVIV